MRITLCVLAAASLCCGAALAERDPDAPKRNSSQPTQPLRPLAEATQRGGGLAPTTWGFTAKYSGTLYGSGYYPFRVDLTYNGTNSIYGYTFAYPSNGFVNEIRAIYVFDISGLVGQPAPIWSAFMLDAREVPPDGGVALSAFAEVNLVQAGAVTSLEGLAFSEAAVTRNIDVYDAEDFENATPFDTPEAAFIGDNTLIGSFAAAPNVTVPFSIDVSAAVAADSPAGTAELVTTAELNFPPLIVGDLARSQFVVATAGAANPANITINSCSVAGTNALDFRPGPSVNNVVVAPGASVNLPVIFRPLATGPRTATLTCTVTGGPAPTFSTVLNGSGVAAIAAPALGPLSLSLIGVLLFGTGLIVVRARARG